ncbi:MAG: choice-of-anchor D domain-containing protein, partial [Nitrosomonas sp.]|nr:choice-of-anchor D domain-containing protein [Nitrosomonas sp.]
RTIPGTASNDTIDGAGGSDFIDGGAGTDTAVFFANRSDFNITNLSGVIQVTGLSTAPSEYRGVTTQLTNIERVQFTSDVPVSAPEITVTGNAINILDGDSTPSTTDGTSFGNIAQGAAAAVRTFTVKNDGNSTLTLGAPVLPSGFSIVSTNPLVTSLAPGASDTFQVRLDSAVVGTKSGQISIATNDGDENPFNFSINGAVTAGTLPEITVTGNAINILDGDSTPSTTDGTSFGNVVQGGAAIVRTFTVKNEGSATLTLGTPVIPAGYSIVSTNPLVTSLAPGASDTFQVRLNSGTVGTKSGQISISTNDSDENPFNFSISGAVTNPLLNSTQIFNKEGQTGGDDLETSAIGALNAGEIKVMADFAKAAYNLQGWEIFEINNYKPYSQEAVNNLVGLNGQGWARVGLTPSFNSSTSVVDGYTVDNQMANGFYTNGNAAAFVARSADAIVISFRGTNDDLNFPGWPLSTDWSPDQEDWIDKSGHYDLMHPLVTAVENYIVAEGINKVYVTGHSLGGAMAIKFLDDHANGNFGANYEGVTFAAASYDVVGSYDPRMTLIEIKGDAVADTGGNNGRNIHFVGDKTTGSSTDYHSMDYYRQMVDSVDNVAWNRILNESGNQFVYIGGEKIPNADSFIVDGRQSGTNTVVDHGGNTLTDPSGADYQIYYGGRGGDTLTGGTERELFLGGSEIDIIMGRPGNDRLFGDGGDDRLDGGIDNDTLIGGLGIDTLIGFTGNDTFRFDSVAESRVGAGNRDIIEDFQKLLMGDDTIDLRAIDANSATTTANDAFVWKGTAAFTQVAGELRYFQAGGNTIVEGDINANGVADFQIELLGLVNLVKADFLA